MTRLPLNPALLAAATAQLRDHPDFRILERLPKPHADVPECLPPGGRWIGICDVETTGVDHNEDAIIELALMCVAVSSKGEILGYTRPRSWLQDPGRPLSLDITRLTGLSDADLAGQMLDEPTITAMFGRCDVLIAHNAKFDVGFIDRRLPATAKVSWACSCAEVPWPELGFPCRKLEHLLLEVGGFYAAHRAESDVWALYQLLQRQVRAELGGSLDAAGRTYLQLLLASSDAGAVRLRATGAPYAAKDWLKARGYSWDPMKRVWSKDVPMEAYFAEKAAFADEGLPEPTGTQLDAVNRHRI